ncbi:MAG: sugar phosphate isomerase/epimerase [Anaerolineaceae bacterium]|nr:sugar phosphate isomerase/epimerase [Anaerolineaceae bacterium]
MIAASRIGVCTWIFGAMPLQKMAADLARMGFGGVELRADYEKDSPAEINEIFGDWGLAIFSLTPMDVDLSHPEAKRRHSAIAAYDRLLDFAAALEDEPYVCIHGRVGRIRAQQSAEEESELLVESVSQIAEMAATRRLRLVFEVLNRYESHQVVNCSQALQLLADVGALNLGILLDAYHMNIEESDPVAAIHEAGAALWLYHCADSNRRGLGFGHTDWRAQLAALAEIGYRGPLILECTAVGPDPFTPIKSGDWRGQLCEDLRLSLQRLTASE